MKKYVWIEAGRLDGLLEGKNRAEDFPIMEIAGMPFVITKMYRPSGQTRVVLHCEPLPSALAPEDAEYAITPRLDINVWTTLTVWESEADYKADHTPDWV